MQALFALLIRILLGEPYRKSTDWENRFYIGILPVLAIVVGALVFLLALPDLPMGQAAWLQRIYLTGQQIADSSRFPYILWFGMTVFGVAVFFAVWLWARLIPSRMSFWLGVAAWAIVFWSVFRFV